MDRLQKAVLVVVLVVMVALSFVSSSDAASHTSRYLQHFVINNPSGLDLCLNNEWTNHFPPLPNGCATVDVTSNVTNYFQNRDNNRFSLTPVPNSSLYVVVGTPSCDLIFREIECNWLDGIDINIGDDVVSGFGGTTQAGSELTYVKAAYAASVATVVAANSTCPDGLTSAGEVTGYSYDVRDGGGGTSEVTGVVWSRNLCQSGSGVFGHYSSSGGTVMPGGGGMTQEQITQMMTGLTGIENQITSKVGQSNQTLSSIANTEVQIKSALDLANQNLSNIFSAIVMGGGGIPGPGGGTSIDMTATNNILNSVNVSTQAVNTSVNQLNGTMSSFAAWGQGEMRYEDYVAQSYEAQGSIMDGWTRAQYNLATTQPETTNETDYLLQGHDRNTGVFGSEIAFKTSEGNGLLQTAMDMIKQTIPWLSNPSTLFSISSGSGIVSAAINILGSARTINFDFTQYAYLFELMGNVMLSLAYVAAVWYVMR